MIFSSANAETNMGISLKLRSPGMYGKEVLPRTHLSSTGSSAGYLTTTTPAQTVSSVRDDETSVSAT